MPASWDRSKEGHLCRFEEDPYKNRSAQKWVTMGEGYSPQLLKQHDSTSDDCPPSQPGIEQTFPFGYLSLQYHPSAS